MYLIVGLGNPGLNYMGTRHNAGFDVLDILADRYGIDINRGKYKGMTGEGMIKGKKAILLKPMTYMNLSGESVVAARNFIKPSEDELIVVYDDSDIKPGGIRIKKSGSAGGHNGIKSIIALTGTDEFHRVRVGIGPKKGDMVSHVLGRFQGDELISYKEGLKMAADALEMIIEKDIDTAMNTFNVSSKKKKTAAENEENEEKAVNAEKSEKTDDSKTGENKE